MSKFQRSASHRFGAPMPPPLAKQNFETMRCLDNRYAKAPVYKQQLENPFCRRPAACPTIPECKDERREDTEHACDCKAEAEPVAEDAAEPKEAAEPENKQEDENKQDADECRMEDLYKSETAETVADTPNPQHEPAVSLLPATRTDVQRFLLKRQSTTRW